MAKRKAKRDLNQLAASIVELSTDEKRHQRVSDLTQFVIGQNAGKNPAAVALGRLGGLKGGKARAEKLSAKRRRAIAKSAAIKRWDKKPK
jgi:hypothetical protein